MNGSEGVPAKKMLIINILDILRKYTDEEHRLSQRDIAEILAREYGMTADRKAIKRNLMDLMDCGYSINYSETVRRSPGRSGGEPVENTLMSDFYLEREFTDSELRLLIDSLIFSKHIPANQCRELAEKLGKLSNVYFRSRVGSIRPVPDTAPRNRQLFYTIELLDEAISRRKQVAFYYNSFGVDKKPHPRLGDDGKPREYIINPYQIAAANGRYYLICNYDKYDNVANYRLDRITDIRLLDTPVKPMRRVRGLEGGLDLPKHMAEHIYMYGGESVPVTFRAKKSAINEIIDWLGTGFTVLSETEDTFTARVTINYDAMRCWALQYARYVRVLSPQSLVDLLRNDLREAAESYAEDIPADGEESE